MDKNQSLRKDHIEAWKRYVDGSYTSDDLALVLDLIRDDANLQEFEEVWDKEVWNRAMNDMSFTTEERKKVNLREAAQLLAEYENKQITQTILVPSRNRIVRFRKIWYAAAAAILLGLLIPAAQFFVKPKAEQTGVQYVEEITQRGEIKTVFLPDQTEVTLNAGSRIIYPTNFTDNERSVELYGEALFDVTSDPARPFIVTTENMNVKVVGTVFNVKEYEDDMMSSVWVTSGKVEVEWIGGKALLEKNQQVRKDNNTGDFERLTIDADKYLSWTDGVLYFNRTTIHEVVNVLNRHYLHIEIILVEGDYSDILISGKYENIHTVEDILKSIVYITNLKCTKKEKNRYILYIEN